MKKYIRSKSVTNSNHDFKWIKDEYLGGNMIAAYGQLADGKYFYASDVEDWVWLLNANPEEMFNLPDTDDWTEWLQSHDIGSVEGKESYRFWIAIFEYCKQNNIKISTYSDLDYAISEYSKYL